MLNLVENARDAIGKRADGKIVRVHAAAATRAIARCSSSRTTAPACPRELKDKVFAPYFTTKHAKGGTGLGLAIVHRIISDHGGRIIVSDAAVAAPGSRSSCRCATARRCSPRGSRRHDSRGAATSRCPGSARICRTSVPSCRAAKLAALPEGDLVDLSSATSLQIAYFVVDADVRLPEFVIRIEPASSKAPAGPDGTWRTSPGLPITLTPLEWALHSEPAPLFNPITGVATRGLEQLAEDGNPAALDGVLAPTTGISTPIAPGVFVLHEAYGPLFVPGSIDSENRDGSVGRGWHQRHAPERAARRAGRGLRQLQRSIGL